MARAVKVIGPVLLLTGLALWTAQTRAADVVRGHIQSVSTEESEFVMTDPTGKEWHFRLADSAVLRRCDGIAAEVPFADLGELRAGDAVTVTYTGRDMPWIALEVCVNGRSGPEQ
jgi:hypothetical protein